MLDSRQSPWPKRIDRWLGTALVCVAAWGRPVWRFILQRGRRLPVQGRASRVLVIKLSALGDLVVMFPALYLLTQELGEAQIDFLGGASNVGLGQELRIFKNIFRFSRQSVFQVLKLRYDLVIDYDQWVRATALITAASRSSLNMGFKSLHQHRHYAYDAVVDFDFSKHNGENFWNLTAAALTHFGRKVKSTFDSDRHRVQRAWRPRLAREARAGGQPLLPAKYTVIHPGCGEHGQLREWPLESWRALVRELKIKSPDTEIVITGHGEHEVRLSRLIAEAGAVSLAGQLTLAQLIGVLAQARGYISCNTGIMHLASFLNDHIVSINGPTNPRLWGPLWAGKNLNSPVACAPCLTWGYDYGCADPVCVKVIKPEEVSNIAHA